MPRKKITPKEYADAAAGVRLSAHEKLCAERMKQLLKSVDELNKKVSKLSVEVSTGKDLVKVLVFLGTVATSCIDFFNWR